MAYDGRTVRDLGDRCPRSSIFRPPRTYAVVRSGDLQGIQIGGRNQWGAERSLLEEDINGAYRRAAEKPGASVWPPSTARR